jgi:hypothetical protein
MCYRDLLQILRAEGITPSEAQIRWAISSGKVSRPPLDGSLRFDFGPQHLEELRTSFLQKQEKSSSPCMANAVAAQ